ncbi:MAG TPA: DUF3276 family protein [Rectinemataceae bacterium]|nr:DUF3276 family protein [Rectinemataceae bacterium]
MGIRGELFSTRVSTEGRTYFFNVKENRMGDVFLTIVESKPTEAENFERRSIVIFRDNVKDFLAAFQNALSFMEKPGAEGAPSGDARGTGRGSRDEAGPRGGAAPLRFDPAPHRGGAGERGRRAPAGFSGSEKTEADQAQMRPKRRIVVRKKDSGAGGADSPSSEPK